MKEGATSFYRTPWGCLLLVYVVVVVFLPSLHFDFVYLDVRREILDNPYVHGLTSRNLKYILTSRCITSYYPLRTLTYAVDYQIWGPDPYGFKLTNVLIHLASVLLLYWLCLRLAIDVCRANEPRPTSGRPGNGPNRLIDPGNLQANINKSPDRETLPPWKWWDVAAATMAAGVFAVHPVVVQPVAWVAGREELLMTFWILGCFHAHLTARRLMKMGGSTASIAAWHVAATCCCAAASLSSAVGAVTPLLITAWDLLMLAPPKLGKIVRATSAMWVIGAATIAIKMFGPPGPVDPGAPGLFSFERLMLVLNTYRLNLATLFWPKHLALSYIWRIPRSFIDADVVLALVAVILTGVLLWRLRRRKLILFGLLWFGLALGPTSQVLPHHVGRADRFLYLPLAGLSLAMGMSLCWLAPVVKRRAAVIAALVAGVATLHVLIGLSARQVQTWRDGVCVWEHAVSVEPENSYSHCRLADNLVRAGQFERAFQEYETALRLAPEDPDTLSNFAWMLATCDDRRFRNCEVAVRLADRACRNSQRKDPKALHQAAIVHSAAARDAFDRGEYQQAIQHYRTAIQADPEYDLPLFNLSVLLGSCPDVRQRDAETAVRLAEQAWKLTKEPSDFRRLDMLAEVYAAAGRLEQAISTMTRAIALADAAGDRNTADTLRARLKVLRAGLPAGTQEPRAPD